MNFLTLKALMAAVIAGGRRASETETYWNQDREKFARACALDAEAVLAAVLDRATADDNQPLVYVPEQAQP